MDIIGLLLTILFGAVIGLIAGFIMKTKKGWVATIAVGILGALLGNFIVSFFGIGDGGWFNFSLINILVSIVGACLIVVILRALKILK